MPWIDLEDVKAHMDIAGTATDAELTTFIDAACTQCEEAKGHIDTVGVPNEDHAAPSEGYIVLREYPVASVTTVSILPGDGTTTVIPATDALNGVSGWTLEGGGKLTLPTVAGIVRVAYTAGVDPVPGDYKLAALILVEHHWKQSKRNASGGRPQRGDSSQMVMPGFKNAMPFRVRELLGLLGEQARSRVFVA